MNDCHNPPGPGGGRFCGTGANDSFTRVKLENGKTVTLRVTGQEGQFLKGYEVDAEGEEITGKDFERRLHIIEKALIVKHTPMRLNMTYARLERAGKPVKHR